MVRRGPCLLPDRHALFLRDLHAGAVGVVLPRMIGADDAVLLHPPQRQGRPPVDAEVTHRVWCAVGGPPDDQMLVMQLGAVRRLGGDVACVGDGVPAVEQLVCESGHANFLAWVFCYRQTESTFI